MTDPQEIAAVAVPLNVLFHPGGRSLARLAELGVVLAVRDGREHVPITAPSYAGVVICFRDREFP